MAAKKRFSSILQVRQEFLVTVTIRPVGHKTPPTAWMAQEIVQELLDEYGSSLFHESGQGQVTFGGRRYAWEVEVELIDDPIDQGDWEEVKAA